jgi:citrate synthase
VTATGTHISLLDAERGRIVVRGYDLIELAHRAHFADVAFLLIHGSLPGPGRRSMFANALGDGAILPRAVQQVIEALPRGTLPLHALRTGISALAGSEPPELLEASGRGATVTKGVRILSAAPTIVANAYRAAHDLPIAEPEHDLSYPARFLRMIPGATTDDEAVAVFDRVLTCHAEDGPSALTLAARGVAAGGGDVYGAVTAAATLQGGLHHGSDGDDAGHRIDPGAALLHGDLLTLAARHDNGEPAVARYERAARATPHERGGLLAALATELILWLLDIPDELFVPVLLCPRTAGLVAHVIEQHDERGAPERLSYGGPSGLRLPHDFVPAPL